MIPNPTEKSESSPFFDCIRCWENRENKGIFRPFIVCPACGNKRCPKDSFHGHPCSDSNESGQNGSYYGNPDAVPVEVKREGDVT